MDSRSSHLRLEAVTPVKFRHQVISKEISSVAKFYDEIIQYAPLEHDDMVIFDQIESASKSVQRNLNVLSGKNNRSIILLNGNFNHSNDIQKTLLDIRTSLNRQSRLFVIHYNPYWKWLYSLARFFKIRQKPDPNTFITRTDLQNFCKISDYELCDIRNIIHCPWKLLGLGNLFNFILPLIPGLRWLSFVCIFILKPRISETSQKSLTIVIPARNEAGNIENSIKRLKDFKDLDCEIIYVEGHSKDNTWEEILRVQKVYQHEFSIKALQQTGKGKNDAVRAGFSIATKDILTILDADLTMPPELLKRFYDSYQKGHGDFINGSRLVYPMENEAMQFLNRLGNLFFAKVLSFILGTRIGDSLCGTKLLARHDYERIVRWRKEFGDFDPFGDFELLFPAGLLSFGIVDIPIQYRARTYGTTNISRFRHGLLLFKMTFIGLFRIRAGRTIW